MQKPKITKINKNYNDEFQIHYPKDSLLSIEQVGTLLNKKPQTIRNWVAKRQIPFVPTSPVMFLERSIWTWLKDLEVKSWR